MIASPSKPVIGVITNNKPDNDNDPKEAVIYHIYIGWLEACGALVLPIFPWYSKSKIDDILGKVNGVIMQGGSRDFVIGGTFEAFNKYIFDKVIEINQSGKIFPLWATCQGFELIYYLLYNDLSILQNFDSWKYFIPMELNQDNIKDSNMYACFTEQDFIDYTTKPTTVHLHNYGVDYEIPSNFKLTEQYKGVVNLVTTSYAADRKGKRFIGTSEDKKLNLFLVIFHPENLPYNYALKDLTDIYHDKAFNISLKLGQAFIERAKLNGNQLSEEEKKELFLIHDSENHSYEWFDIPDDYNYKIVKYLKQNNPNI